MSAMGCGGESAARVPQVGVAGLERRRAASVQLQRGSASAGCLPPGVTLIAGRMQDPTLHPTPHPCMLQAQARLKGGERRLTARPRAVPTGNTSEKTVSMISSASDLSASSCVGAW